jgi:hypothetical protein
MKSAGLILVAVLAAGCGDVGLAEMSADADVRGSVGGAPAAGGGAGGSGGLGGLGAAMGGATGAGGAAAGTGGATGSGGAGEGGMTGAGGAAAPTPPCIAYNWDPSSAGGCTKLISIGVYQTGFKDGHQCVICGTPARPAGTPECTRGASGPNQGLCVLSCSECTFQ